MKVYAVVITLLFLISVGYIFWIKQPAQQLALRRDSFSQLKRHYPYLSNRVLADLPQDYLISFLPLRKKNQDTTQSYGNSFGMYFEYLPTGTSIGVNSTNEFYAASLFKLPVIMAYYRDKEKKGERDDEIVTIKKEQLDDRFGDLYKKGAGKKISLGEAVKLALQKSDNTAAKIVSDAIDQQDFQEVYQGLDIDLKIANEKAIITPKNYSSILKALYFSAVLDRDDSQEILDLLTKTDFSDKLPDGVPKDIPVAHKIGVVEEEEQQYQAYLDCGIVYAPARPYSLCMVSVSDEDTARIRMKHMSKMIYQYVTSVKH